MKAGGRVQSTRFVALEQTMTQWILLLLAAAAIAVVLGVVFQAAFWHQPITPQLAFLFVVVGLVMALIGRGIWSWWVTGKKRG